MPTIWGPTKRYRPYGIQTQNLLKEEVKDPSRNEEYQKVGFEPGTPWSVVQHSNAGINLTGYYPPGHSGAFAPKCVPSPRAFAQQKYLGAGPINDDVPGAGHLHQHEDC